MARSMLMEVLVADMARNQIVRPKNDYRHPMAIMLPNHDHRHPMT